MRHMLPHDTTVSYLELTQLVKPTTPQILFKSVKPTIHPLFKLISYIISHSKMCSINPVQSSHIMFSYTRSWSLVQSLPTTNRF